MLKIKNTPIIEKIILEFKSFGFNDFVISVNYLGNKIIKHLGSGHKLNVNISGEITHHAVNVNIDSEITHHSHY